MGIVDKWDAYRKKCPKCGSSDLENLNIFKQAVDFKNGRYIRKEFEKVKCNYCGHIWWK